MRAPQGGQHSAKVKSEEPHSSFPEARRKRTSGIVKLLLPSPGKAGAKPPIYQTPIMLWRRE